MSHDDSPDHPARVRRPVPVSSLVKRLTRASLGSRGLAGAELIAQWSTIVGADLSALATPQSLKAERGSEGGTLLLRVASSAAATLLQLKGPQIVERVNRFFGYRAVARLQVVPGSAAPVRAPRGPSEPVLSPETLREIEATVAAVPAPDLRDSLARLGAAVRRRAQTRRGP